MSRSGYIEDLDPKDLAMWRGRVASAMRGKRGQQLLRDLRDALDAMPIKALISDDLELNGEVCALGAVGKHRGVEGIDKLDPENHELLANKFNVAPCMIQEIEWYNDEHSNDASPERRWRRMREWVESNIKSEVTP